MKTASTNQTGFSTREVGSVQHARANVRRQNNTRLSRWHVDRSGQLVRLGVALGSYAWIILMAIALVADAFSGFCFASFLWPSALIIGLVLGLHWKDTRVH